jgi:hypothetical protein
LAEQSRSMSGFLSLCKKEGGQGLEFQKELGVVAYFSEKMT